MKNKQKLSNDLVLPNRHSRAVNKRTEKMTHLIILSILHLEGKKKKNRKKSDILLPDEEILSTSTATKDYDE